MFAASIAFLLIVDALFRHAIATPPRKRHCVTTVRANDPVTGEESARLITLAVGGLPGDTPRGSQLYAQIGHGEPQGDGTIEPVILLVGVEAGDHGVVRPSQIVTTS
jgi:hypothetical protein